MNRDSSRDSFRALAVSVFVAGIGAPDVEADALSDFYRGKNVSFIVTTSAGGDYDRRARLVAQFMEKYIPGQPKIVVQNMPGGGGIRGINYIYRIAPRDGTVVGSIEQLAPLAQAFGQKGVEYDLLKGAYIGNTTNSPIVLASWHTSPVKTLDDATRTELVVAASGAGSANTQVPRMLNALIGTKFKIVSGYPGGNEMYLAMERGEVAGRLTQNWAGWKSQRPDWLRDRKLNLLAQAGSSKHPELGDVALLRDFAKTLEDRQVLDIYFDTMEMARPFWIGPEVPADRVAALRKAFDATMADAEFLSEAKRMTIDIEPTPGEEVQRIIARVINAPDQIMNRARSFADEQ
jgi:tripartite-type tricarboxylate transporter receptor subunit TctC